MKTQATKNKFMDLRAKGLSYDKIAKQLKVSKQTLINWSKELEIEIANLKAIELETLLEKYYGLKQKRIELFGKKLDALNKELEKRTLDEVSTGKLFELISKYMNLLKQEAEQIFFKEKIPFLGINMAKDDVEEWEG